MIAVVQRRHFRQYIIGCHAVDGCQLSYFRLEVFFQFFKSDTAKRGIIIVHANIIQLVEIAEHADLRKLRHPGEEHKTQVTVCTLEYTIESFQRVTVIRKQSIISPERLQKRLVILVNKHNNFTTGLLVSTTDNLEKTS